MKQLLKILFNAFASTLKGNDGKISSRKTTAFWFVILATADVVCVLVMIWLALFRQVPLTEYTIKLLGISVDMLMVICAMILLLFGIVTIQQIQNLKFLQKDKKDDEAS